jgi:predicted PurR-regulated permease PerM
LKRRQASRGSLTQTGLLLIAVFVVLYIARAVFAPFAFALMFYFMLRPAVRLLARAFIPGAVGSAIVLLGLAGVLGGERVRARRARGSGACWPRP